MMICIRNSQPEKRRANPERQLRSGFFVSDAVISENRTPILLKLVYNNGSFYSFIHVQNENHLKRRGDKIWVSFSKLTSQLQ